MSDAGERFSRLWLPPNEALSWEDAMEKAREDDVPHLARLGVNIADPTALQDALDDEGMLATLQGHRVRIARKLTGWTPDRDDLDDLAEVIRDVRLRAERGEESDTPFARELRAARLRREQKARTR